MRGDTRTKFLDVAEGLFAERGFYGVSIAAIADELGLTKQALLHHFGSKAKLYGEVLKRISDRFEVMEVATLSDAAAPETHIVAFFSELFAATFEHPQQTRLLMRELLDNQRRAETAEAWFLKPFLQRLIKKLQAVPGWQDTSDAIALAYLYQWLGAINYYGVSGPTLTGIFGPSAYDDYSRAFKSIYQRQIAAMLVMGPET